MSDATTSPEADSAGSDPAFADPAPAIPGAVLPELCRFNAVPLARMIRARETSAEEVMRAYLGHIDAVNGAVNAIVSLRDEADLLAEARAADAAVARGDELGPMHGLPQAIKDLAATKGLRTTFGSPIFASFVPPQDAIFVERMRRAGSIIIGKTNVPEFGYGSNSYNPVFGLTRNAWNRDFVGGGSSGGAAVALAMRMLPVADGSDMGGSLRNPAGWNNIYGFRPSQGRVPVESLDPFYGQLATDGPMGRSAEDLAMLLAVQSGYDPRAPLSLETEQGGLDLVPAPLDPAGLRIGWLGDFDGHLAMEPGVLSAVETAVQLWARAGARVENLAPGFDMEALWQAFCTLRQYSIGGRHAGHHADPALWAQLKPEAQWEVKQSLKLTSLDIWRAAETRGAWYRYVLKLFEQFDFLLLPTAQVMPFAADIHWPEEVGGRKMDSYHRWMEVVAGATMAGLPAVSVPAGFGRNGLPVGMQIIGKPRGDGQLLRAVATWEQLCPLADRLPPMLQPG